MISCRLTIAVVATLSLLQTCQTHAANWFVEGEVGAMYLKLPEHHFLLETDIGDYAHGNEEVGSTSGGRIGWVFDRALGSADMTNFEFSGFVSEAEDTAVGQDNLFFTFGYYGNIWVDTESYELHATRRATFGGYDLSMRQSFRITEQDLLSVHAGFSALHLHQDLTLDTTDAFVQTEDHLHMRESLDADYYGIKIGLTGVRQFGRKWTLLCDAAAGFYGAESSFLGEFDTSTLVNDPPLSLSDRSFAFGSQLSGEIVRKVGRHSYLSFWGEVQHLNYAPQIEYINDVPPNNPLGTRLVDDELLGASIGAKVVVYR